MYRSILVPVDDSEQSYGALEVAGLLASASGARVTLFHVQRPPEEVITAMVDRGRLMQLHQIEKQSIIFGRCRQVLSGHGVEAAEVSRVSPSVATAIIEECRTGKYDAIVMGHRGRAELKRLLLGSVAHGVLVEARCPTIMVHIPGGGPHPGGSSTSREMVQIPEAKPG